MTTGQAVGESQYEWKERSREYARKNPGSYLHNYPNIVFVDDEFVAMSVEDWFRMDDYSISVPGGIYFQKVWRGDAEPFGGPKGRFMGMFRDLDPPEHDACETKFFYVQLTGVRDCDGCEGGGWLAPGGSVMECPLCHATGQLPLDDRFPKKREPA